LLPQNEIRHGVQDSSAVGPRGVPANPGEAINITVLLCTFNRGRRLSTALDSVAAQILPDSVSWEVVVVDNNSTDQTREIVERYCRRYPGRFRYIFESHQGLSRARNTGIRESRGGVIAFIDDDVIAEPTWLQNLTASLYDGKWSGAGGRIVPPLDFNPPDWFTIGGKMDLVGAILPVFDLGDQAGEMLRPPYGTNMAYRKSMFERHGMFRTDLGRCGNSLVMGEDTEFGNRLMAAGGSLRYEPSAVVEHPVPEERLSKKFFRSWWLDYGRTRIIERGGAPPLFGIPRQFLSLLSLVARFLLPRIFKWMFTFNSRRRFYNKCQVWLTMGEIAQTYQQFIDTKGTNQKISPQSQS
jgi:glycosyltransferase involved in cell wall biosynthesis